MKENEQKKGWIDAALQGTHDHHACILPRSTGVLSTSLFNWLFSRLKGNRDMKSVVEKLPRDAVIVYAAKYRSRLEYLYYYTWCAREGLPRPRLGFGCRVLAWQPVARLARILLAHLNHFFRHFSFPDPMKNGYFRRELLDGGAAFLPLVEKGDFYRMFTKARTSWLQHLIEIQKTTDRPIIIIPGILFFGKNPRPANPGVRDILFGSEQNPGKLRRLWTLLWKPGKAFSEISDPVNLKEYIEAPGSRDRGAARLTFELRRNLTRQFNLLRRSITGPTLKSNEELRQSILTSEPLQDFMKKYAKRRKLPIHQVRAEAVKYVDEVAARYNPAFVKALHAIAKQLFNRIFDGLVYDEDALNRVKNMSRKGPVILMPCHRSHIDYIVLSYIIYNQNMPCPHIFAGENLSFWPMGSILRRGGAFFVRRSFAGAVFYSKVFAEYIHALLKEGFNIEVFIEGTRSRTGKLLPPQLGMLSILLNAFKNGACEDMIIVPVFIGYDQLPEEDAYLRELRGEKKEPENLLQMIQARKILEKRFGKIYINFDEPVSLKEHLAESNRTIREMKSKEVNLFCRNLGGRVFHAIDRIGVATPGALVAGAILNDSKPNVSEREIKFRFDALTAHLITREIEMTRFLASDRTHAADRAVSGYLKRKYLFPLSDGETDGKTGRLFRINAAKRPALEIYKNNCIPFFIPAAFTALAILEKDAFQFSSSDLHNRYISYQDFFENEFTRDPDAPPAYIVRKTLKAFIDDGIIVPHPALPDTYNITSIGFRKLKLFAGFTKPFFESHLVVLRYFKKYPKSSHDAKRRLKKIRSMGEKIYKRKEIDHREALSAVNYTNAVAFFLKNKVKGSADAERISFYEKTIKHALARLI
ncbi:MAG: glycerol-3-phosphate acyltransferase [Desulfobacterales bacterium]|nr:glycerol-3-phosphate acyltransferase [Desulfobacterales bacterium]